MEEEKYKEIQRRLAALERLIVEPAREGLGGRQLKKYRSTNPNPAADADSRL
jgi:hypothetical protein